MDLSGVSHFRMLRRRQVELESGHSRSALYEHIAQGLWPKPVNIGARSVAWPAHEVRAMNCARVAGEPEIAIRALVQRLERARRRSSSSVQEDRGPQEAA